MDWGCPNRTIGSGSEAAVLATASGRAGRVGLAGRGIFRRRTVPDLADQDPAGPGRADQGARVLEDRVDAEDSAEDLAAVGAGAAVFEEGAAAGRAIWRRLGMGGGTGGGSSMGTSR